MRVLFLDVDGVLNHELTGPKHPQAWTIDSGCLRILKSIIDATQCQIILSSSWRFSEEGVAVLEEAFEKAGIPKLAGKTPLGDDDPRAKDIKSWLDVHNVDKFAILDDEDDAGVGFEDHFFQTSFLTGGLQQPLSVKIIQHLL